MVERFNLDGSRRAVFSDCFRYRYELQITWDITKPVLANCGLNPSTADEFKNDPTVHRDLVRADTMGFGSLLKLNLFPWRDTDPFLMKLATDPYGEWRKAERILQAAVKRGATKIIAAWGNHGTHRGRSDEVRRAAAQLGIVLYKYDLNQSGEPVHPLYKPYSLLPTPYLY